MVRARESQRICNAVLVVVFVFCRYLSGVYILFLFAGGMGVLGLTIPDIGGTSEWKDCVMFNIHLQLAGMMYDYDYGI